MDCSRTIRLVSLIEPMMLIITGPLGYADREGIIVGNRFSTFRTRFETLESTITSFLKIGLNSGFASRNEGYLQADWEQMTRISSLWGLMRLATWKWTSSFGNIQLQILPPVNPFFDNLYRDRKDRYNSLKCQYVCYSYIALRVLNTSLTTYLTLNGGNIIITTLPRTSTGRQKGGSSERTTYKIYSWQVDNLLRWKRQFNKIHNFEATFLSQRGAKEVLESKDDLHAIFTKRYFGLSPNTSGNRAIEREQ